MGTYIMYCLKLPRRHDVSFICVFELSKTCLHLGICDIDPSLVDRKENIVIVNTESFGDNIPDLIKSFGVDLVIWLYSRLKEDDVDLSLFIFLGAEKKSGIPACPILCARNKKGNGWRVFIHHR